MLLHDKNVLYVAPKPGEICTGFSIQVESDQVYPDFGDSWSRRFFFFFWKVLYNGKRSLFLITNIFNFQSNIHPYNTRSSSRGNFFVQYSRLEKQNKSFNHGSVLKSAIAYLLKCVTRQKRILNSKFIILFFKNSRRQTITLTYLIWSKTENILKTQCIIFA